MFRRLKRFFSRLAKKCKPAEKKKPRLRFVLDSRSRKNLEGLNKKVQPTFVALMQIAKAMAKRYGVEIKIISGHRSYFEQASLYAQGRTKPGKIVTYAKPGYSNHNFGTAIDLGTFNNKTGAYMDATHRTLVSKIYKSIWNNAEADGLNLEWGGNWRRFQDTPHFEYITGLTLAEMRRRKEKGLPITV